jgi:hypothetical protein
MAQDHIQLLSIPRARRSGERVQRAPESHVVVATQNLPRMSGTIQALIKAGHMVTAYASPTRLLPRLTRFRSNPVSLLIIDGGRAPAFARAAAIAARASYPSLPSILLAHASLIERTQLFPTGVTLLGLPASDAEVVAHASTLLASGARGPDDDPPDAA